ncbi:MAG TPA: cupin domain-containing protein [Candidatus Binatia bacterium]|jgi:quercetin dioxygenase-like cupin family protein|nr:cupin domain-containing protein [Candidatus Binatia bacterium]
MGTQVSREEMAKRIARFQDLQPIDYSSFIKNYKPDGTQGYALIGRAGKTIPPIEGEHGFFMGVNKVSPGKGTPLHSHTAPEVFMVLSGTCAFVWGNNGENEAILRQWDTISFPAGVKEGFRNVGEEEMVLLVVLGASDVGEVTIDQSAQLGATA